MNFLLKVRAGTAATRALLKALYKYFLNLPGLFVYFVIGFMPRDKDLWVFGSWEGMKYCDNAKYLFQHVNKYHPEIKAVWLTKEPKVFEAIKKEGATVHYTWSWRAFWTSSRAQHIFITHNLAVDVNPLAARGATIINLFHATFPIKKMGYDHFSTLPQLNKIEAYLSTPFVFMPIGYAISPSRNVSPIVGSALNVKAAAVVVTGLPRTDYLLSEKWLGECEPPAFSPAAVKNKKMIYYVPTFRGDPGFDLHAYGYDQGKLEELLERINAVMLIRYHPFDAQKYRERVRETERIMIDRSDDIYATLKYADLLITDYSSIGFDFLLLNRPMIFACYDYDGYLKERPLYHDYRQITPGPKVRDWPALAVEIENLVLKGKDEFKAERARMSNYIYHYRDDQSSKRIIEFVKSLK
jgi:CDP-glycerol glycerophosphotransferase (TagB/SpsB family)